VYESRSTNSVVQVMSRDFSFRQPDSVVPSFVVGLSQNYLLPSPLWIMSLGTGVRGLSALWTWELCPLPRLEQSSFSLSMDLCLHLSLPHS
jgi:hypothetical protein